MDSSDRAVIAPLGLFFIATVGLIGCGGSSTDSLSRAAVAGKVTLDGINLKQGVIRFVPTGDTTGPKVSVAIEDGRFSATAESGPVIGGHRIEIQSTDNGGYAMDDEQALERLRAQGKRPIEVVKVPAIYNSSSTLHAAVTVDGPNEYDFALSSKPARRR